MKNTLGLGATAVNPRWHKGGVPPKRFYEYRIRRVPCVTKELTATFLDCDCDINIAKFLRPKLLHQDREHFFIIHFNAKERPTGYELVAVGTTGQVEVHPGEIFRSAIIAGSRGLVLAHNHPSGDPFPSGEDDALTERMINAGKLVGIQVLDHVVFGHDKHYGYCLHDRIFGKKA